MSVVVTKGLPKDFFTPDFGIHMIEKENGFKLDSQFLSQYDGKKPNFGYNGLGEFVFYRTYSRLKGDGTKETPVEVFQRVVEGCYEIQRRYCNKQHIPWSFTKAQRSAQEMFKRMWEFKFLPPGRGLWAMGTKFMWERGSASLNNCGFCSTIDIDKDPSEPFEFMMDMSMVGVGVGFDSRGANKLKINKPHDVTTHFAIPDSREGWVLSLKKLIQSYTINPEFGNIVFDYSEIRPAGTPINGFGGKASGPGILQSLHCAFKDHLDNVLTRNDHHLTSVDIVDLMNYIGRCVVAGNVRRTAQLALGEINDIDYVTMKNDVLGLTKEQAKEFDKIVSKAFDNDQWHFEISDFATSSFSDSKHLARCVEILNLKTDHRWASNNSLFADVGMDYTPFANSVGRNGEPGFVWMDNVQNYGRMADGRQDGIDKLALGTNPCFAGDTKILTNVGYVRIDDLWMAGGCQEYDGLGNKPLEKYGSIDIINRNGIVKATNVFRTGQNIDLFRVSFNDGSWMDATSSHEFIILNRNKTKRKIEYNEQRKQLCELNIGDLIPISSATHFGNYHDPAYSELAGWCIGDGTLSCEIDGQQAGRCGCYENDIDDVLPKLRELMLKVYYKHNKSSNQTPVYAGNKCKRNGFDHEESIISSKVLGRLLRRDGVVVGNKHNVPISVWEGTRETVSAFLRGLASADGYIHIANNGTIGVRISQSNKQLLLDCKLLLNQFGISSSIYYRRRPHKKLLNDGKGNKKLYNCKAQWELIISGIKQTTKFLNEIGFIQEWKSIEANKWLNDHHGSNNSDTGRYVKITSIELIGKGDTYCLNEPDNNLIVANGYQIGQCGEQSLENYELCCLVEVFPSMHDDVKDYHRTLKFAYLYGKTVALMPTHNRRTNAVMMKNRRIGLSNSGIMMAFEKFGRYNVLKNFFDDGYKYVNYLDEKYSKWLCCPRSIKKTSVKPSGSVSLLVGSLPGIHYNVAPSEHYWRRIRLSADSVLVDVLKKAGYHVEPAIKDNRTMVVKFGISTPGIKTVYESSIFEQVKNAVDLQKWWSDNSVSVTVQFKSEEVDQIPIVLSCFDSELKTISFLPISDHGYQQAPYEAATEQEIIEYNSKISPIDFAPFINEDAIGTKFCDTDSCTLKN